MPMHRNICRRCNGSGQRVNCEGTGESLAAKCVACLGTGKCDYCDGTGHPVKKSLFEWLGELLRGRADKRIRSDGRRKVGYISREELVERIRKQYSAEYAEFLLVQMGYSPQVCPKCGNGSFTTLCLADPSNAIEGKMWAKWYFWCDKCLSGIRCPLGTWRIPRTTPYILHGDEKALAAALPENLTLALQK